MGTYRALEANEAGEDAEACGWFAALGRAIGAAFRPLLPAAVVAHDATDAAAASSRAVVGAEGREKLEEVVDVDRAVAVHILAVGADRAEGREHGEQVVYCTSHFCQSG